MNAVDTAAGSHQGGASRGLQIPSEILRCWGIAIAASAGLALTAAVGVTTLGASVPVFNIDSAVPNQFLDTYFLYLVVFFIFSPYSGREKVIVTVAGAVPGLIYCAQIDYQGIAAGTRDIGYVRSIVVGGWVGAATLAFMIWQLGSAEAVRRRRALRLFAASLVIALSGFYAVLALQLSGAIFPLCLDGIAFHIDQSLGLQPSTALSEALAPYPAIHALLWAVYLLLPFGFAVCYAVVHDDKGGPRVEVMRLFVVSAMIAFASYAATRVTGPFYAFAPNWPKTVSLPSTVPLHSMIVNVAYRNGIPSMHCGWALIFWLIALQTRRRWFMYGTFVFLVLTLLSTLERGEHYLCDLVIAVPLALALHAHFLRVEGDLFQKEKRRLLRVSGLVYLAWIGALNFAPPEAVQWAPGVWLALAATIVVPALLYRRVYRLSMRLEPAPESLRTLTWVRPPRAALFPYLIGLSGVSLGLYFGIVAAHLEIAGQTLIGMVMVGLAAVASGMALAALRLRRAWPAPLTNLAAVALLPIWLFILARFLVGGDIAVRLMSVFAVSLPAGLGSLWAALVLTAPMAVLLGATLATLEHHLGSSDAGAPAAVAGRWMTACGPLLWGLGAGLFMSTDWIIPWLGLYGAALVTGALQLVCVLGFLDHKRAVAPRAVLVEDAAHLASTESGARLPESASAHSAAHLWIALGVMGVAGAALGCIPALLDPVVGTNAYATILAVAVAILGARWGGTWARPAGPADSALAALAMTCALLAAAVLAVRMPDYFAAFFEYPTANTAPAREFVRAFAAILVAGPIALAAGALLGNATPAWRAMTARRDVHAILAGVQVPVVVLIGLASAVAASGMFAEPLWVLYCVALAASILGVAALVQKRAFPSPLTAASVVALVASLLALQPAASWAPLTAGSHVHFAERLRGTIERATVLPDGRLITLEANSTTGGGPAGPATLWTNGVALASDDTAGKAAELASALIPASLTASRASALVVGYGSGLAAATLREAGFERVQVLAATAGELDFAVRAFSGRIPPPHLDHVFFGPTRSFMASTSESYDVVTVLPVAAADRSGGALFTVDFYRDVARRLSERGVFLQSLPAPATSPTEFLSLLWTSAHVFSHVKLYQIGERLYLVATHSRAPLSPAMQASNWRPGWADEVNDGTFPRTLDALNAAEVLSDVEFLKLAESAHLEPGFLLSTDDNLRIEREAVIGNTLDPIQASDWIGRALAAIRRH